MSYLVESSIATSENLLGCQRLALPYDAPGFKPNNFLVRSSFLFLAFNFNEFGIEFIFRLSLMKLLYFIMEI